MYEAMQEADEHYDENLKSASGLVGTEGKKMRDARLAGTLLCGDFIGEVMEKALRTSESNACMKRIVAAPTAGSCGVVPAVFLSVHKNRGFSTEDMVKALYVAAGIGGVIANPRFFQGRQAAVRRKSVPRLQWRRAALWLCWAGALRRSLMPAALALKNLLGLACDPVAGLVEVPCVKRNVMGAVNAMTSADMTMAGILSKIPPDEVIDAMRSVGRSMAEELRETGKGGLAATPTGMEIMRGCLI